MFRIIKTFKASEKGIDVVTYTEGGEYKDLPPVALSYGKKIGAIENFEHPNTELEDDESDDFESENDSSLNQDLDSEIK